MSVIIRIRVANQRQLELIRECLRVRVLVILQITVSSPQNQALLLSMEKDHYNNVTRVTSRL